MSGAQSRRFTERLSVQWTDTTQQTLDPPVTSSFGSTVAKVPGDLYQQITAAGTTDGGPWCHTRR